METLRTNFAGAQKEEMLGNDLWSTNFTETSDEERRWEVILDSRGVSETYWNAAKELVETFEGWCKIEQLGLYYAGNGDERTRRLMDNAGRAHSIDLKNQLDFFALSCLGLGLDEPQLDDLLALAKEPERFEHFVDLVHQKQSSQAPAESLSDLMSQV